MSNPLILGTNSIKDTGYEVANSLRLDEPSNQGFTKTPGSAGNRKTFTLSAWVKRSKITNQTGDVQTIFESREGNNDNCALTFQTNDTLSIKLKVGGTNKSLITNRVFRDVSAWYHLVCAVDTTQSTDSNRVKIYVNGVQETSFGTEDYVSQDAQTSFNNSVGHGIGKRSDTTSQNFDGYLAEVIMIDGSALDPTSFGEFDSDTNIWKPKDVSGLTFGTNGFYLDFENSSSLGADVSGNGNNFTVNNLTSIDQSTDTCTNNAVTFTATDPSASNFTISQGGLKIDKSGAGTFGLYGSSIMLSSGKWYWEAKMTGDAGSDRTRVGLAAYESVTGTSSIQGSYSGFEFTSVTSGRFSVTVDGTTTEIDGFNSYSTGDIIMFALDMDNTKLYVGINGDWFNYSSSATGGDPTSGSGWVTNNATALAEPVTIYGGHAVGVSGSSELEFNFGATNTFTVSSGNSDANGYGNFEFAVPSGYYAINTKNLAEYG